MILFTNTNLVDTLRSKCDDAKERIWIVSPFIGDAKLVDCILGKNWSNKNIDRRLIFDSKAGSMSYSTLQSFLSKEIAVRSLYSIHAKIYIVDNWCLITSANLTESGFSKRIEVGSTIESKEDVEVLEKNYLDWWSSSENITIDSPLNEIHSDNHFSTIHKLPQYANCDCNSRGSESKRYLKSGEYRIDGLNLYKSKISGRTCVVLQCKIDNDIFSGHAFVVIYDSLIVEKYRYLLNSLCRTYLNYKECDDLLPIEYRYLTEMKSLKFRLEITYVRRYIEAVSPGTCCTCVDNYDGWEYDCAITQSPICSGLSWSEEKQLEREWEKNPFPTDALPIKYNTLDVYVKNTCSEQEINNIREWLIADFYAEYNKDQFPARRNKLH